MTHLLDTSAILAHARGEWGADQVQRLFEQEDASILVCSVTLAELAGRLRELGATPEEAWTQVLGYVEALDGIVPVDETVARESDRLRVASPIRLPLVDAVIAAAARTRSAILVHRDRHLRGLDAGLVQQIDLGVP